MKTAKLATMLSAACASALIAADAVPPASQLQGLQKNIARQHHAANILVYDAASKRFVATEAAATWLDDDVTTAWAPLAGKQYYMLQLAQPQLINNFELSGRDMAGTIALYTGDSAAAPGDAAWTAVVAGVDFNTVNNKRLGSPINKFAKYLLIETNIAEPKSIYGLHVYGDTAAASHSIVKRTQPVDISTIGEFVNNQTAFNVAGLYAKARVTFANSGTDPVAWQQAIDDKPETFASIAPNATEASAVLKFDAVHPISRLAFQSGMAAKGTLDVFLLSEAPEQGQTVNIEGISPSVSFKFDGSTDRVSADIAETNSVAMAMRWTPEGGTEALAVREINAFADLSIANFEVIGTPVMVAKTDAQVKAEDEAGKDANDGKTLAAVGEGKETVDVKGGKEMLPPVALGPRPPGGYRPGSIGFPPNISVRPPAKPPVVSPD